MAISAGLPNRHLRLKLEKPAKWYDQMTIAEAVVAEALFNLPTASSEDSQSMEDRAMPLSAEAVTTEALFDLTDLTRMMEKSAEI